MFLKHDSYILKDRLNKVRTKFSSFEMIFKTETEFKKEFKGLVNSPEYAESAETVENNNFLFLLIKRPKNYP